MTSDQVIWAKSQSWFREYEEIANLICPLYRVRVSDSGLLVWFKDFNKLLEWSKSQ